MQMWTAGVMSGAIFRKLGILMSGSEILFFIFVFALGMEVGCGLMLLLWHMSSQKHKKG